MNILEQCVNNAASAAKVRRVSSFWTQLECVFPSMQKVPTNLAGTFSRKSFGSLLLLHSLQRFAETFHLGQVLLHLLPLDAY